MSERVTTLPVAIFPSIAVAFLVTVAFMFALRPVAMVTGLMDRPGGHKQHQGEVPVIGGLAMFAGLFAGMLLLGLDLHFYRSIFAASLLLLVVGVIDDRTSLPATARLATQVAAVLIMIYGADLKLIDMGNPFGYGIITTGHLMLVFTMLVTLSMINAYNMIDGIDGLAGSLSVVAFVAVAVVAGPQNIFGSMALVLTASVLAFLLFNFPVKWSRPVLTFMGDSGSTLLGFAVVWVTIGIAQGPAQVVSPVHCLWFAAVPIFDCFSCFVCRSLNRKSPFAPGRDHFHHILARGGFGVRQILGILTGLQLVYASLGLAGHFTGVPDVFMFAAWAVLGLLQRRIIKQIAKSRRLSSMMASG